MPTGIIAAIASLTLAVPALAETAAPDLAETQALIRTTLFQGKEGFKVERLVVPVQAAAGPVGRWEGRNAFVTVAESGGVLTGTISELKTAAQGADPVELKTLSVGKAVFIEMQPDAKYGWVGRVYRSTNDDYVWGSMKPSADGQSLKVTGCVAIICKSRDYARR